MFEMGIKETAFRNENNLKGNSYPGRGIIIGQSPNRQYLYQVYWIMGRSENSRNRVFEKENSFVKIKPFDESKVIDPSLIIYYPVKNLDNVHIVSNGDQTDTLYDSLKVGDSIENALFKRTFEPDEPN
jgi:IMP cyclohydrolase